MNIFDKSDIKQQEIDTLKTESSIILHKVGNFVIKHSGVKLNNDVIRDKIGVSLKENDWVIYESNTHYATLARIISFENKIPSNRPENGGWYANIVMIERFFDFIEDIFKHKLVTIDVPVRDILKYDVKKLLQYIDEELNQTHIEK